MLFASKRGFLNRAQAITHLENYTGLTYDVDENFSQVAAVIAAQTSLSIFTSFSAFLLIVFVEPPIRFWLNMGFRVLAK